MKFYRTAARATVRGIWQELWNSYKFYRTAARATVRGIWQELWNSYKFYRTAARASVARNLAGALLLPKGTIK